MMKPKKQAAPDDTKSINGASTPGVTNQNNPATTSDKWKHLYLDFSKGVPLEEALKNVGWNIDMEPHAKKNWKDALTKRSIEIRNRIAKGEAPFPAGSKQAQLFDMLKAGCTGAELKGKFGEAQLSNYVRTLTILVGGDLVKTERKGITTLKLEFE